MFNNNYNNNQQQAPSINSKLVTWYSDLSCIQLGLWNNNMSVKLNVAKGKNQDGIMQYDFDNRISTAIVPDRAADLLEYIEADIIPEMKNASAGLEITPKKIGFDVGKGKSTRFMIEYVNDESGVPSAYLCLYSNGSAAKYKFNKYEYVEGENATPIHKETEFYSFVKLLRNLPRVTIATFKEHGVKNYEASAARFQNNGQFTGGNSQPQQNYNAPISNQSGDSDYPF